MRGVSAATEAGRRLIALAAASLGRKSGQAVVVGLLVAVLAGNVALRVAIDDARDGQGSGTAALESASTRIPVMLSYDFRTFDAHVALAVGNTTGEFADEMRATLTQQIKPDVEARRVVNQVQVASAGVVKSSDDSVTVLMLMTQVTQAGAEAPVTGGVRVLATMKNTDDGWLVSGLEPI